MREPSFWWRPHAWPSLVLAPLGWIYGAIAASRLRRRGEDIGAPVICVGNYTLGGAGKTPAVLALVDLLRGEGQRPFVLSRGYRGTLQGPVLVDAAKHSAIEVGDEPLLLARLAPTIVARNRVAGARTARSAGASVIVMDDGFQNPSLAKDLAIVLVDGVRGIGNGRIIPAGPLRAPLEIQIAHAHALVIVGPPGGAAAVADAARRYGVALFHGRLEPDANSLAALGRRKVLAFAGIGDPEKFFATLGAAGIEVAERASFPDHHRYTAAEAQALLARATAQNLVLITTEKDFVRLAGDPALAGLAARSSALPVRLVIDEQDAFKQMVLGAVKRS